MAEVTTTPRVASVPAGASTERKVAKRVRNPPSNRIKRQRDRADGINEPHILEMDAERPGFARQHADDKEDQQQRPAETQGDQARQDAGQHQKRAEQDQKADRIE